MTEPEMQDDELLAALGEALAEPVPHPDPGRVDSIRAAAFARQSAEASSPSELDARGSRRLRPLLVAAAIALVAVSAIAFVNRDEGRGQIEYAGPISGVGGGGELTVTETGIGRVIELDTADLPILPTGEYYEVWFVGPGDSPETPNRISGGTFHPDTDGRSKVTFAAAVNPVLYPIVQITSEEGDGDPSSSGVVVLEAVIN